MKDFEVTIRLRNNQLKQRRLELGASVADFAKKLGISIQGYRNLENMRRPPMMMKSHQWSPMAQAVADFYKVDPFELFPESVLALADPIAVRQMSMDDMQLLHAHEARRLELPSPDESLETSQQRAMLAEAIKRLGKREQAIVLARLEGNTLLNVAKAQGVTREHIRMIESRAHRRIREHIGIRKGVFESKDPS